MWLRTVIMWTSAMVACVVVVSAGLLRRWPLLALAVLVGPQTPQQK
jgi:hypothetical protein